MTRLERLAPLTGVASMVLLVPGFSLLSSGTPKFMMAGPKSYLEYYEEHQDDVRAGAAMMLLAAFLLLWFVGSVRSHLRAREGGDGRVTAIAHSGGIIGVVCLLLAAVVKATPALRLDAAGRLDGGHAAGFSDAAGVLFGIASPVAFAVLVLGSGVLGLRCRALPAWLSWVSVVLGVLLAIPFAGWIGLLALPVWILVLSVLLYRTQAEVAAT